jgi:multiple sugar transport system permease protein
MTLLKSSKTLWPHALLIVLTLIFLIPFYWMFITAFKTKETAFTSPIEWLPRTWHWENIPNAANYPGFPFIRYLGNSVYYAVTVTVGTVMSCSLVGYALAKLRFPGRNILFYVTVATLMIPWVATFIPTFIMFKQFSDVTEQLFGFKVMGSYLPLILPAFGGNAFYIFLMRQFFMGLPNELSDAARVDGAGEFRIFWQILLPLVKPALVVMAVFTFVATWQDFFGPLVYLTENKNYPLSLGLYAFRAQRTTEWALMMAASMLTTLPLIILFFFTQRYFLEGVKLTGIKG